MIVQSPAATLTGRPDASSGCKDSRFIELSARFEAFRGIGLAKKSSVEGRKASHPKTFASETLFSILAPMAPIADGGRLERQSRNACWHHSIDEETVGIPRRVDHMQFDSASGLDHVEWAGYPRVFDQHLKVERNKLCSIAVLSMTRPVQLAAFRRAVRRTTTSAALFRRSKSSAASTLIVFQINLVRGVMANRSVRSKTIIDGV